MKDGRRVWSDEEVTFLKEFAPGHSRLEVYEELGRRFPDHTHTFDNMVAAMKNRKIRTGTHRWYGHRLKPEERDPKWYRDEELAFLKEYTPGHSRKEIHAEYNRRFPERPRSYNSIVACMKNHGYIWVKVDDQINAKKNVNWKQKQRLIWEQEHGPVPEGMFVTFLDGNRENFDLSNLALITRAEHARLNQSGLRSEDPEITAAALQVAKLTTKIGQLQRDSKKKNQ